jgi:hypothetical protein
MSIIWGALTSIVATFPLAALCALLFRFPVPFAGYLSGADAVGPALWAVVFYGVPFGGFVVQGLLGGLGGLAAEHWGAPDRATVTRLSIILGITASAIGVFALAILDKIIGPW